MASILKNKKKFFTAAITVFIVAGVIIAAQSISAREVTATRIETGENIKDRAGPAAQEKSQEKDLKGSIGEPVLFLLPETDQEATEEEVQMTDEEKLLMKEYMAEKGVEPFEEAEPIANDMDDEAEIEEIPDEDEPSFEPEQSVTQAASYRDILIIDPGLEDVASLAYEQWESLPASVRAFVAGNGWQIRITSGWFGEAYGFDVPLSGLTVYDEKTSYITGTEFCINRALIHEIGHIVDAENGYPSLSDGFVQIYNTEAGSWIEVENYGDDHGKSNTQEFFAETFKYILRYGEAYADTAPATYAFVHQYMP